MKKVVVLAVVVIGALVIAIVPKLKEEDKVIEHLEQYDNEEKPKEILTEEEIAVNQRRLERMQQNNISLKSASAVSSYANGKITGTWEQFQFRTYAGSPYGFRTKGSVYDQKNDVLYAMMEKGHLWKINRDPSDQTQTTWEIMNHHENFVSSYIDGITTSEGTFRMVRSGDSGMEYSNDEGRTWNAASGVQAIEKSLEGATIKVSSGNRIFALLKTSSSNIQVFVSDDDGLSYQATSTKFNPNSYWVKLFRVHNSESVFLAAYQNSTSKVIIYEHEVDGTEFNAVNTSSNTFVSLDHIFGTYHDGTYHFYVGTSNTYVYYSSDKGATWSVKQFAKESGNTNVRVVHPLKPNMVFRGYLDVNMSTNYGASFSNFKHALGWDVHHMKFYQRTDGSYFHFLGKDFGCYISDTPEDVSTYISLNDNSPAQMCYDAAHSEHFYSSFTATQDRGTVGFENQTNDSRTYDVRTTDGLRVTLAYNDASVWTWMYFGNIIHTSNFAAKNSALAGLNWTGNWWAAPMIASPVKNEDAVYVAAGPKLKKFTYNPASNSIIQTELYFNFENETGAQISGFAYSPMNKNRWYVSTLNGTFLYSQDGGQTFTSATGMPAKPTARGSWHKQQHTIKASDVDEKTVYYAGGGNVFLISKDGGKTFTNHSNGLDIYRFYDFDLSADEKFIYAACGGAGIWVYAVDDDKWYEINDDPVPFADFTDVEFLDKRNEVKFSSWGSGVLTFKVDGEYQNIIHPDNLTTITTSEGVELNWEDLSGNENGFIIEREYNGTFKKIGEVASGVTSFVDKSEKEPGDFIYRVKAFNGEDLSYSSNYSLITLGEAGEVAKSGWKLVSVNSEATNGYSATNAFDNDISTMWHTDWTVSPVPSHPHTLVIDMVDIHNLRGFSYLPRQDNNLNGTIKGYEFYISTDNENWTKVAEGSWAASFDEKLVEFSNGYDARYVKLVALSEVNGSALASCAEISVFTQMPGTKALAAPQFVQGGRLSDSEIELIWLDKSSDEDGFVVEQLVDGNFTEIYTGGPNVTTYKLANTNENTTYKFRVAAFNSAGYSAYSDTLSIYAKGTVVGIEDNLIATTDIKVYPNPFTNEINIKTEGERSFSEWEIYDMSGRELKQGIFSGYSNLESINTSELNSGNYVLKLQGEQGVVSKIIIKK